MRRHEGNMFLLHSSAKVADPSQGENCLLAARFP